MKITETIKYPVKFLGLTYYKKRTVTFEFVMGALYELCTDLDISYSQLMKRFEKEPTILMTEFIYYGAKYHSMKMYEKPFYTKKGLLHGFSELDEEVQHSFINKMNKSLSEGIRDLKSEKKKKHKI